jgi:5-methyltetrahydrofolate--homocysteine methyltransferase
MGALITKYLEENLINIIGGCCGSTPDHIAQIAAVARLYQPRKIEQISI